MHKYLFFDGSTKFFLRKRFYVIAGVVGDLDLIKKLIVEAETKFGDISKKERNIDFALKVGEFLVNNVSEKFLIAMYVWDNKLSDINKKQIKDWKIPGNRLVNDSEEGEIGIIGRFWAQCQWILVENLKSADVPILWMDKEEKQVTKICEDHFKKQTKGIEGAFFGVQHDNHPPEFSEKELEKFLCLPDYLAYCLMQALNGKNRCFLQQLYTSKENPYFSIKIMYFKNGSINTLKLTIKFVFSDPTKIEDIQVCFEEEGGKYFLTISLPRPKPAERLNKT